MLTSPAFLFNSLAHNPYFRRGKEANLFVLEFNFI